MFRGCCDQVLNADIYSLAVLGARSLTAEGGQQGQAPSEGGRIGSTLFSPPRLAGRPRCSWACGVLPPPSTSVFTRVITLCLWLFSSSYKDSGHGIEGPHPTLL